MTEEKLLSKGYRKYRGREVDVYFNQDLCEHVGNCVAGSNTVFSPGRIPWIIPNRESTEKVIEVVENCPTKALAYILKENKLP